MIGNPKWFSRRKYGGWGFFPNTKEGWIYIGGFILLTVIISSLTIIPNNYRTIIITVLTVLFLIDAVDIMIHLYKDERETAQEALAERNASWTMVMAIMLGIFYQMAISAVSGKMTFDPVLIIVLAAGAISKSITNWYLRNK